MNGKLHLSKNRSYNGLGHLVPTFLLMDDSANELPGTLFSGVATPETAGGCFFGLFFFLQRLGVTRASKSPVPCGIELFSCCCYFAI